MGTLLIIGAVVAAFGIASNPYSHGSGEYEGSFEEGSDLHYRYEDLSPQAQEIFRQTLGSDESVDTSEKAPDFEYSKGTNIYIIEYQNELYALSVSVERNSFFFTGAFILGAIGVVLLVHGSGRFH